MKRGTVFWLLLVGLVAVALRRRRPATAIPSIRDGPLGIKASFTLGDLGDVVITPTVAGFDTAVLLRDDLTDDQRSAIGTWVESGGTLLVADPSSSLHPGRVVGDTQTIFGEATVARGDCSIPPLSNLTRVDPSGGVLYDSDTATQSCFTRGDGAFVVADPRGDGWVVAVGGAGAFVNARLDSEDNAALAANIAVPHRARRVRAREPDGEGDKSPRISCRRVRMARAARRFVVFKLRRGRRLGRPVAEVRPVESPAPSWGRGNRAVGTPRSPPSGSDPDLHPRPRPAWPAGDPPPDVARRPRCRPAPRHVGEPSPGPSHHTRRTRQDRSAMSEVRTAVLRMQARAAGDEATVVGEPQAVPRAPGRQSWSQDTLTGLVAALLVREPCAAPGRAGSRRHCCRRSTSTSTQFTPDLMPSALGHHLLTRRGVPVPRGPTSRTCCSP